MMDYSLIQRTPDGTGKILVTTPGSPDKGSYVLEADMKIYTNQGMVAIADIVDDLVTADAAKPLSANQGVVLKQLIDAFSGGIVPKGDILSSNLPPADASNKGWQYYCTDINQWATSDGTQWIMTSNNVITQTPDATDTGHALSNAVVTQCCNEVKGKLNQHESRLENLEQKAGDYTTVQYRGTNAVPTGKAKYGLVKSIVGKSRAWNQLVKNGNFSNTNNWSNAGNVTSFSVSGNVATVTVNSSSDNTYLDQYYFDFVAGHKYLLVCDFYNVDGQSSAYTYCGTYPSITSWYGNPLPTGSWYSYLAIRTAESTGTSRIRLGMRDSSAIGSWSYKMRNCHMHDLTLIFGPGNEPSTVADALAQLPSLGQYNAYDAGSLVSTEVNGVKSGGFNLWDEQTQDGYYNANGVVVSRTDQLCTLNRINIKPNTAYYFKSPNPTDGNFCFYDASGNFLSRIDSMASFVSPPNAYYLNVSFGSRYGATYNHNVCINISGSEDGTYKPYREPVTLSLSETVTLRSAGSVADTDELNVEVLVDGVKVNKRRQTTRVGSIVLDGSNDEPYSSYSSSYDGFEIYIDGIKVDAVNPSTQMLSDVFPIRTARGNSGTGLLIKTWTSTSDSNSIYLCGTGETTIEGLRTWLASHVTTINFNLATPNTELIDPIIDNFIEVEGGGTIDTIQTQTPVIDNSLDVGYLAV